MKDESKQAAALSRPRILIVGCGDVGLRVLRLLRGRYRVFALTRDPARCALLRAAGAVPLVGDLDNPASLHRLAGLADCVLHLAPPQHEGRHDARTRALLPRLGQIRRLVYVSTTGVYGDCQGARFDETRQAAPENARAHRRVDAERCLRRWARHSGASVAIVRAPGIYANDRLPVQRLRAGTPALAVNEDVYTNHIHADDLARIVVAAICRGAPQRVYHGSDDSTLKMGDYFDAVADAFGLARPERLPRALLATRVSAQMLSFMNESRRLVNRRIKAELGVVLRYPTTTDGIAAAVRAQQDLQAN